jgi:HAD superfamily hydrolase (TIGR01450 family)
MADSPVPVICDLDGVIWLSHHAIPGSPDAVAALRAAGHRVLFVTNNSFGAVVEVEDKLAAIGIPAVGDVLTSAMAAARLVHAGERVLLCGGPGIAGELRARGAVLVDDGPCDTVMIGYHPTFDYAAMRRAAGAVRAGARLVATNDDATYPTPDGPIPGCGAILAGVVTAAGVKPLIAGKPHEPLAELVRAELGPGVDISRAVMIGDRADTDGLFARTLGCRFGLVLSGVVKRTDLPIEPTPDLIAEDMAALVRTLLAG